ncbi:phage antirepressor KilAC domain-containing protein [Caballeronia sp. LZ029]|uniref:phage antirepressor KilAC domain-containing protein n=1 Tax=Caballeronia sp. LZ029 TaxID=3038564 RepID=UPI002860F93E|nr:phage antirepressor KilAC domain-containing protein [Caballeronia sp. LZ029]MDR5742494.1 phage antirepressor KilAC domain-containing protein [Caballeronia sp. LZ029]
MNAIALSAPTMSSREIADLVESRHDKVKQSIERLAARGVIALPPLGEYLDSLGRRAAEYQIGKRDSYVIVAQLSPEFTARLVDRWQALEEQVSKPQLPDFTNPAIAARAWADEVDKNLALQQQVIEAAPKVAALERLTVAAQGAMCITDAAKNLQEQPKRVFEWMQSNGWIYRRPGGATWTAYQDKLQRGVLEHKITTVHRNDGSEKVTTQVLVTAKGLTEIAQKMRGADLH